MSPVAGPLGILAAQIAERSQALGRRVEVDLSAVASRAGLLPLGRPGLWSPNRACRLVQAADGWIAVNLAREEDPKAAGVGYIEMFSRDVVLVTFGARRTRAAAARRARSSPRAR